MTWTVKQCAALLKGNALLAMIPVLCGFTTTALDPEQAEIVPSDVQHFLFRGGSAACRRHQFQRRQGTTTEGTADFIASLVLPEPNIRQYTDRWQYGCAHEAELAGRYIRDEDVAKIPPWMYDHNPDLQVTDFKPFFTASSYPSKAPTCVPQTPAHAQ
jgi:hypothetical protein